MIVRTGDDLDVIAIEIALCAMKRPDLYGSDLHKI